MSYIHGGFLIKQKNNYLLDKKTKIRYNRNIKYLKDSDELKSYFIYTGWQPQMGKKKKPKPMRRA